ncbi:GNAT family N-acetyltransferase [Aliiroseovarius sp. KMU-50]|uniref:GNAT family N-acetyltransferase n=1 Tax=Aliiroseovarius salicola TaxID=3009082 RepID=A0ABT4W280_9RHOB|nr:GNAT family N-acetyltransferase [Aliiroseovarius sp. KMU-50]MDA5094617.1 GNAT family N-acetyltransferase [Aliiroseovarius sp. KMU-50]
MNSGLSFYLLSEKTAELLLGATVFDNPVDPAQLAAFVADPGHEMIFVVKDDQVIGFASGCFLLHPDKPAAFFINEVGVERSHRQQGIGKQLVSRILSQARRGRAQGIWLATEGDNQPARCLYRSLQGRETPDIRVFDWDGMMDDI